MTESFNRQSTIASRLCSFIVLSYRKVFLNRKLFDKVGDKVVIGSLLPDTLSLLLLIGQWASERIRLDFYLIGDRLDNRIIR